MYEEWNQCTNRINNVGFVILSRFMALEGVPRRHVPPLLL